MVLENDVNYTFKNPTIDYAVNMNPLKTYLQHMETYVSKKFNLNKELTLKLIREAIKENKPRDPKVVFNRKKENGDMERVEDTLKSYLKDVIDGGHIIVPSFTVYNHPSERKSLHAEFLFINVRKRAEDKHKSFEYKQLGNKPMEDYYSTMQKIRKIFNNAVSGAYGSKGSILSNPSGHYTLTSITRSVASIGNMTTESMIAGNKYFRNPEVTINYVVALVNRTNVRAVRNVIDKYDLYIPSANEVMDMILYSSRWYWENKPKENIIFDFIKTLNDEERCMVMYCNDLWHFKQYNDKVMRDIVKSLGMMSTEPVENHGDLVKKAPEGILNLALCICSDLLKGKKFDVGKMQGTEELNSVASTIKKIMEGMDRYWLFFRTFYTTDIMPTSVAYIRDMLRDAIVLSDTDSTCGSYDKWLEWYYGEPTFNAEAVGIANAIMTINTQVMDHHIKILAANMNIDKSMYETLKMKNEFYWSVFIATNVSKHYYAFTEIQEGNTFKESELELKGVHLIASSIKIEIKKLVHQIMKDLLLAIKNKDTISLGNYIQKTIDIELSILNGIKSGNISYFKRIPIKGAKSYKQGPEQSPYQFHLLWERIFADKYGSLGEPPYTFVKVPLTMDNKAKLNEFVESITDTDIKLKFKEHFERKGVGTYTTIRLPMDIVTRKGIPEEIVNYVNTSNIIEDSLYALYMVLETLGFYRKPGMQVYQHYNLEEK